MYLVFQTKEADMPEEEIGKIVHYYNNIEVGLIELTASLKVGDSIHIKGAHDDFTQAVESMKIEQDKITDAKAGDVVGVKVAQKVHENDKVYKVAE